MLPNIHKKRDSIIRSNNGFTLIEILIVILILGIVTMVGLPSIMGALTKSRLSGAADEVSTAESIARSQLESAKIAEYVYEATSYTAAQIPSDEDYVNYSANISAEPLNNPDDGIQKIWVTIKHSDKEVITLEGYKVDR